MAAPLVGFLARLAAKRGHALLTRNQYKKINKDFKGKIKGKEYFLRLNPKTQQTESVPVIFKD